MNKVIVQVPVSQQIRDSAERVAEDYGFSSLQEVMRIFMKKFADRSVGITIEEIMPLSIASEKRYLKIDEDIKQKKNSYRAKTVNQLMQHLHGDRLP